MNTLWKFIMAGGFFIVSSVFAAGQLISPAELADIEKQGKSAVISTHAEWCSTCKAQDKILAGFIKDPDYKNVVFYQVDYDNQKDLLKTLKVRTQSTIIVYKNGKEVARATGDTKEAALSKLTRQAI
ncbi:MAG: thioredoxin family protein [Betaproteobacteria bacterium]|nr:thioredoxin family protein [Betaproteobacteria bacterium]